MRAASNSSLRVCAKPGSANNRVLAAVRRAG